MQRYLVLFSLLSLTHISNCQGQSGSFSGYLLSCFNRNCSVDERDSTVVLFETWKRNYCVSKNKVRVNYDVKHTSDGHVEGFKLYSPRSTEQVPIVWVAQDSMGRFNVVWLQNDITMERVSVFMNDFGRPESLFIGGLESGLPTTLDSVKARYSAHWFANGQLHFQHFLDSSDYEFRTYYPSGRIHSIGRIARDMLYAGRYIEFFESGSVQSAGNFKSNYLESENVSVRIGTWLYWNESGCLVQEEDCNTSIIHKYECIEGSR